MGMKKGLHIIWTDALSDRKLLAMAKQIGGSWMDLGRALQFPDDELQEILQNEGMSYQGAFKVQL